MILGGGPNRIGQGIEFDYCCCHASFALRELGIESIMVNSNPETVSTDYDTSDLSVLRAADDRGRAEHLRPHGAGRRDRAVRRADAAEPGPGSGNAGVPIIGTSVDTIEDAEDREKFQRSPAATEAEAAGQRDRPQHGPGARAVGRAKVGFPVLVRPSFVLGGRAMEICYDAPSSSGSWPRPSSWPRASRC